MSKGRSTPQDRWPKAVAYEQAFSREAERTVVLLKESGVQKSLNRVENQALFIRLGDLIIGFIRHQ